MTSTKSATCAPRSRVQENGVRKHGVRKHGSAIWLMACAGSALAACKNPAAPKPNAPPAAVRQDTASASAAPQPKPAAPSDAVRQGAPGPAPTPKAAAAPATHRKRWSFDDVTRGLPQELDPVVGTWSLVTDSPRGSETGVLAQQASNANPVFNLALAKETSYADVDVSVRLKAVAGRIDQGGGVVWRAHDAKNYYIARYNPLEDNFRVYRVKNGRRRQIGSASIRLDHGAWHMLRIRMAGDHIEGFLDGQKHLDVHDPTFTGKGMVGLWTKADARTHFDDFSVSDLSKDAP
ncbi:MAG: hypothetical protein MJD61_15070 [Proteobacteria bacterium]|nr:hypothetical protein [Pseudomonadota bacterium]